MDAERFADQLKPCLPPFATWAATVGDVVIIVTIFLCESICRARFRLFLSTTNNDHPGKEADMSTGFTPK